MQYVSPCEGIGVLTMFSQQLKLQLSPAEKYIFEISSSLFETEKGDAVLSTHQEQQQLPGIQFYLPFAAHTVNHKQITAGGVALECKHF